MAKTKITITSTEILTEPGARVKYEQIVNSIKYGKATLIDFHKGIEPYDMTVETEDVTYFLTIEVAHAVLFEMIKLAEYDREAGASMAAAVTDISVAIRQLEEAGYQKLTLLTPRGNIIIEGTLYEYNKGHRDDTYIRIETNENLNRTSLWVESTKTGNSHINDAHLSLAGTVEMICSKDMETKINKFNDATKAANDYLYNLAMAEMD